MLFYDSLLSPHKKLHFGLIFTCSVSCLYSIMPFSAKSFDIFFRRSVGTFKTIDNSLTPCHEPFLIKSKNRLSLVNLLISSSHVSEIAILSLRINDMVYFGQNYRID